jgi:hypothetical protein
VRSERIADAPNKCLRFVHVGIEWLKTSISSITPYKTTSPMFRPVLSLYLILLLTGVTYAQENSNFIFWQGGNDIFSGEQVLVTNRGAGFNGRARFAFRAASYPRPGSEPGAGGMAYQSWHLELWAMDSIRTKQVVAPTQSEQGTFAYELAFYRGRFADPAYRSLLGSVVIPAERVKQVVNGKESPSFFYSIDLVDVPLYLWSNGWLDDLDIQRIQYVGE